MIFRGKKGALWCLISVIALAMLSGCVRDDGGVEPPVLVKYDAELYFVNDAYAEAGDETMEHYLMESRQIEVAADENPLSAILEALKTPTGQGMGTAIGEDVVFENVSVSPEDETLMIVDLEKVPVGGGSMQEGFFIGQIVETVIRNGQLFEDSRHVDKVQFLVKGEPVESLMGHYDAVDPFTSRLN